MRFTYDWYAGMIDSTIKHGYTIVLYGDHVEGRREAILRHDVDMDLQKASRFAEFERSLDIASTYFVLVRSDFYNVFSDKSHKALEKILACGHKIGLHFDEKVIGGGGELRTSIEREKELLESAVNTCVKEVSMHRPSQQTLKADYRFNGLINSYSQEYFQNWKYVSDSRMHWRENIESILAEGEYERLHILTHPFWYSDTDETLEDKLNEFISRATLERYDNVSDNFTDLPMILSRKEFV